MLENVAKAYGTLSGVIIRFVDAFRTIYQNDIARLQRTSITLL